MRVLIQSGMHTLFVTFAAIVISICVFTLVRMAVVILLMAWRAGLTAWNREKQDRLARKQATQPVGLDLATWSILNLPPHHPPTSAILHPNHPPMVLDGPMNGPTYLAWVRQFLCPALGPGDVVIADNLSSHKVAGVREAIEAAGASVLYLPPYSPDLNPIEKAFAKLKALLRRAGERTFDALQAKIGSLVGEFPAQECSNYFVSSVCVG